MTVLINSQHKTLLTQLGIPDNYGSDPLLPIYADALALVEAGPNIVGRMQTLTPDTAAAWLGMLAQAQAEQIELVMVSGFRSMDYQAGLIQKKLDAGQSVDEILQVNVAPGFSQHHTGNAIDIATPGYKPLLEEFENSPAFAWLQENAGRFGFTLSYPRGNPDGITYEPWHWYRAET